GSPIDRPRRYRHAMNPGQKAPDFELPDETGAPRKLGDLLADGPVVLFFYPAAMTPGCTKESCHFRDLKTEFEEVGAQRVGISADKVEKQQQFAEKYTFDFPLLSDPDTVVVGASLAGLRAAETLRQDGYDGRIVLVGAEERLPYDRPPLSKQLLAGKVEVEQVYLCPPGRYDELNFDMQLGRRATALDLEA